jgi:site-specific recombinase XerD
MVTLYSWKHTGVVSAFQAGLNIKLIQELLRHHSLEMTDIYLKSLGLTINKEVEEKSW